jgi:hypothetical protein
MRKIELETLAQTLRTSLGQQIQESQPLNQLPSLRSPQALLMLMVVDQVLLRQHRQLQTLVQHL